MSLIFAPGKYLTLIFLFLDIFFSLRPDIVDSPKISVVPFHHSSLFCCTVMLSALLVFFILDFLSSVNLFVRMLYGLPYFNHMAVLVFELLGDSCLEGLSIATTKSTPDGLLEKSLNGFITNRCIKFANYWRGIFSFIKFGFS